MLECFYTKSKRWDHSSRSIALESLSIICESAFIQVQRLRLLIPFHSPQSTEHDMQECFYPRVEATRPSQYHSYLSFMHVTILCWHVSLHRIWCDYLRQTRCFFVLWVVPSIVGSWAYASIEFEESSFETVGWSASSWARASHLFKTSRPLIRGFTLFSKFCFANLVVAIVLFSAYPLSYILPSSTPLFHCKYFISLSLSCLLLVCLYHAQSLGYFVLYSCDCE